jgi:hypothetical protein
MLAGAVGSLAGAAHAFEFRYRWVERVANLDFPLADDLVVAYDGQPHQVRLQLGVFDNAAGPAPEGGFYGWTQGSLLVDTRSAADSDDRRTPGRLPTFAFSQAPGANGNPPLPDGDPFEALTDIDASIGIQSPVWGFNPDGTPAPQPGPRIVGRNTYVSVFSITVQPRNFSGSGYFVRASGNLYGATSWFTLGTPVPPDPESGTPGSVNYAAMVTQPSAFESALFVYLGPTPGTAGVLVISAAWAARRRRQPSA